ncbi:MAG: HupE/UreJ family protein [Deltaproteobacteria bacterium]|nr:HupE/UreJ family protein [Deltaproteobacteria bacterium]
MTVISNTPASVRLVVRILLWTIPIIGVIRVTPTGAHQVEAIQNRLDILNRGAGQTTVSWTSSRNDIRPLLPNNCEQEALPEGASRRWQCTLPLSGQEIEIKNLTWSDAEVIVRVDNGDEQIQVALLSGQNNKLTVAHPRDTSGWQVAGTYFALGVEHILKGFDHLFFVLCLLLIVSGGKRLALAITAFTLAHSITLALSVLGVVSVPVAQVEAVIALSVVLLAVEYARQIQGETGWTSQKPWLISFLVGLLHGLGFASALRETGLPQGEIPTALVMFNVGVEAGQLLFVVVVLAIMWFGSLKLRKERHWPRFATAYIIGSISAYWFIQRAIG